MSEQRKKQRRGEETQKNILNTALKLFAEKGYDKVTIDEIVKKSKTSKGSFYQHFTAKSDIFLTRFAEVDIYYVEFYKSFADEMPPLEKLTLFFQKVMKLLDEEMGKDLMKVIYSSALNSAEHTYFLNSNRALFKIIAKLVEDAREAGQLDNSYSNHEVTTLITQSMMGTIYHWGINNSDESLESLSIPISRTIIEGLKKK